jgi:hypothetical protein
VVEGLRGSAPELAFKLGGIPPIPLATLIGSSFHEALPFSQRDIRKDEIFLLELGVNPHSHELNGLYCIPKLIVKGP